MSFVSFALTVLITCGKKEMVVHVPASRPITAIAFISITINQVKKPVNIDYTHYNTLEPKHAGINMLSLQIHKL